MRELHRVGQRWRTLRHVARGSRLTHRRSWCCWRRCGGGNAHPEVGHSCGLCGRHRCGLCGRHRCGLCGRHSGRHSCRHSKPCTGNCRLCGDTGSETWGCRSLGRGGRRRRNADIRCLGICRGHRGSGFRNRIGHSAIRDCCFRLTHKRRGIAISNNLGVCRNARDAVLRHGGATGWERLRSE